VALAVLTELLEGTETDRSVARGEFDCCERGPEVLSQGGWNGFLAIIGELTESGVVLSGWCISLSSIRRIEEGVYLHLLGKRVDYVILLQVLVDIYVLSMFADWSARLCF
jgi:hypothetical protein